MAHKRSAVQGSRALGARTPTQPGGPSTPSGGGGARATRSPSPTSTLCCFSQRRATQRHAGVTAAWMSEAGGFHRDGSEVNGHLDLRHAWQHLRRQHPVHNLVMRLRWINVLKVANSCLRDVFNMLGEF